jgi:hypothetical protein
MTTLVIFFYKEIEKSFLEVEFNSLTVKADVDSMSLPVGQTKGELLQKKRKR